MSNTLNQVTIEGFVGKNPEYRFSSRNEEVAVFIVGTTDWFYGEWTKQWHNVVVIDPGTIKYIKQHVTKGNKIRVSGVLHIRKEKGMAVYKEIAEIFVNSSNGVEVINNAPNIPSALYND